MQLIFQIVQLADFHVTIILQWKEQQINEQEDMGASLSLHVRLNKQAFSQHI